MLVTLVLFSSYKAVPLTKGCSRDWKSCYVIARDKFEGVMTYHTYHFSSNLVTDYTPEEASRKWTNKYNLVKKYMFRTIRIINYQFFTQVTSKKKLQTKLGITLLAITLSGWSSYPESRALRYPLVKCLCYWVLQEFPQGKACMCHFEFTCSGWSGATSEIGTLSI